MEHRIITSPFVGALYPDSVPVVVEGISSEQHHTEVRKTTVVSEKVPINQDLKHAHPLVQSLFPQEQRSGLPVAGKKIETFSGKLEKIDKRPSNFGINGKLSNLVFIRTKANKKIFNRLRNSSNVKKRCHSDGGEISKSVLKSNIFGRDRRLRLQSCDKYGKARPKYFLHSFQNGGSLTFKGASSERRFLMQTRSKGCIFFSCASQNFPEISKVSMAGKSLRVSLPVL